MQITQILTDGEHNTEKCKDLSNNKAISEAINTEHQEFLSI